MQLRNHREGVLMPGSRRLAVLLAMSVPLALSMSLWAQKPEPPMGGIHWARGHQPRAVHANLDVTWHGGNILTSTHTAAIFWGTSWVIRALSLTKLRA